MPLLISSRTRTPVTISQIVSYIEPFSRVLSKFHSVVSLSSLKLIPTPRPAVSQGRQVLLQITPRNADWMHLQIIQVGIRTRERPSDR